MMFIEDFELLIVQVMSRKKYIFNVIPKYAMNTNNPIFKWIIIKILVIINLSKLKI